LLPALLIGGQHDECVRGLRGRRLGDDVSALKTISPLNEEGPDGHSATAFRVVPRLPPPLYVGGRSSEPGDPSVATPTNIVQPCNSRAG